MSKPIKIVFIIDTLDAYAGGTENQLLKILRGLNRADFEILLICFRQNSWFEKNASKLGCSTIVLKIDAVRDWRTYANFYRLVSIIRKFAPDIVQTFFPVGNIIGVLAARFAGVKNIISSRRDFGEWMSARYLIATKAANLGVKKIIANSKMVRELTIRKEGVAPSKLEVFHNGIDVDMFTGLRRDMSLKSRLGIPSEDKVIGIVANFRPMKHHHVFLRAAAEALSKHRDLSFLLVGSGPLKAEMKSLAKTLGISHKTHFAGLQTDVRPHLSIMDIGVNCSEGEGLSNAIMEYMCAGIPCIVARAGGNPDLITHDVNGYTFELDDHQTLATLIVRLLDDPARREAFAAEALKKIKKEMGLATMLSTHVNFYKKLAND